MKYKILLSGKNQTIIDDFFNQLNVEYVLLTSSLRYEDMENHLEQFEPNLMVICLGGENNDQLKRIIELKRKLTLTNCCLAIIGEQEECDNFQRSSNDLARLVMTKPITISLIREQIVDFFKLLEQEKLEQAQNDEEAKRQARIEEERARKKNILIIDDEPLILKMIKEQLGERYNVATAISGKIAYKFLEKKTTEFILLDYEMPVENGPEVMKKIRENPEYEGIPIVFLTGVSAKEKIAQVLALKPYGYLLKPVDSEKLYEVLDDYFEKKLESM